MSSNLPTLLIDCRSGNVVMRNGNDVLSGRLDLSSAELTALSSPLCRAELTPLPATEKQRFELEHARWAACKQKASP